jgi:8-oxo-dGTP pyrophosphatase MutT (NUDIX family)
MQFYMGCGAVLRQGDKFILVQETLLDKKGFYNLPAGTLEIDEDLQACLVREVQEETGVTIVPKSFVGVYQYVLDTGHNIVLFIFAASIDEGATFHSEEHVVIESLSYDEVVAYDTAGKLRSPIVLKAIEDYQNGQRLPLTTVQAWHLDDLPTIRVAHEH